MDMIQLVTLTILVAVSLLNYWRFRDILYPALLQSLLWLVLVLLFVLNQASFIGVSPRIYLVMLCGVVMFSIGSYLATYDFRFAKSVITIRPESFNAILPPLLFWVSVLGLPFFIAKARSLGGEGLYGSLLMNLRASLVEEGGGQVFGVLGYLVTISFMSVWLQVALYPAQRQRMKLVLSILVASGYSLFSTGRTFFIMFFISAVGILLITRRITLLKSGALVLAIGGTTFAGIGTLLGKGAATGNDLVENVVSIWESFQLYLLGSLPALDLTMRGGSPWHYGANSFRSGFALLAKVGASVTIPPLVQEDVFVPVATNVYTVFHPYFLDFSYVGVVVAPLLFGLWHGYIYRRATGGEPLFVMLYAIFLYPLAMQFFQDQYLSILSTWLQFGAILFLCCYRFQLFATAKRPYAFSRPDHC